MRSTNSVSLQQWASVTDGQLGVRGDKDPEAVNKSMDGALFIDELARGQHADRGIKLRQQPEPEWPCIPGLPVNTRWRLTWLTGRPAAWEIFAARTASINCCTSAFMGPRPVREPSSPSRSCIERAARGGGLPR
jgi:hypothetical protein